MTELERLVELLCSAPLGSKPFEDQYYKSTIRGIAKHLLENGVLLAPMPMAEWLRAELSEHIYNRCIEEL